MQRRKQEDETSELDLAPIMNMVVILIPLLLLSVVFLKVGVINVSMPSLSPGLQSDETTTERPLDLTVAVTERGFGIKAYGATLPAVDGCPSDGPTVCLRQGVEAPMFEPNIEEAVLEKQLDAFDWPELYSQLMRLKREADTETTIHIAADATVPYAAIVGVMDAARFQREAETYDEPTAFWSAAYAGSAPRYATLFPDPVLMVGR